MPSPAIQFSLGAILIDINRNHYQDVHTLAHDTQRIPTGTLGHPTDIAGVAAFLAPEDAAYSNGADILGDGGLFVNLQ